MGHLINPISVRLGFTSFWLSNWNKYLLDSYSYVLMFDNILYKFILWVFFESFVAVQLSTVGIFLSHFKLIRRSKNINISVFLISKSTDVLMSQSIETNLLVSILETEFTHTALAFTKAQDNTFLMNYSFIKSMLVKFSCELLSLTFLDFFKFNSTFNSYVPCINVCFLKNTSFVNSNFLSRFISRRLSFGFELNKVLNPVIADLTHLINTSNSKILGFRIACSGRFNKTQMASYLWEKYGSVPLNHFSCSVDYSFSKVFMKYGLCGIKVWIFTAHRPFKTYKSNVLKGLFTFCYINQNLIKKMLFLFLCFKSLTRTLLIEKSVELSLVETFNEFRVIVALFSELVPLLQKILIKYKNVNKFF